ncbi:hypothetical protein FTUN_5622 [Frigoriglobus tundricola]|uniref:Uncharacterized protein n=1 Tax=Frigoriglobus tundricola TaxID=2774151 RepID=A0A6M5YYQ8_9BACT|nr:hypothetical protein FTUN_5622 [Frigoriglobus tundricola]
MMWKKNGSRLRRNVVNGRIHGGWYLGWWEEGSTHPNALVKRLFVFGRLKGKNDLYKDKIKAFTKKRLRRHLNFPGTSL